MRFNQNLKSVLWNTSLGKYLYARRRIHRLVDQYMLSSSEIAVAKNDYSVRTKLVRTQCRKFPSLAKEVNSRIDWIKTRIPDNEAQRLEQLRETILFYYFAYGFSPSEFLSYGLETLDERTRQSFVSDRESVRYAYRLNSEKAINVFMDKNETYVRLRKYYNRDAISIVGESDFSKYMGFVEKYPVYVEKMSKESCGRGVELIDVASILREKQKQGVTNEDIIKEFFTQRLAKGSLILEAPIKQSTLLSSINASSVNSVRCITLTAPHSVEILWCFAKIGRAGSFIDNGSAGGLLAGIDLETGEIVTDAVDEFGHVFKKHPDSNMVIKGFRYPQWRDMCNMCIEMASSVPEAKWIGWDMAHTENGWVIIEGNSVTELIGPQSTFRCGVKNFLNMKLQDIDTFV